MKSLFTRFDELMSAVTFAEAGEFDTARQLMDDSDRSNTTECPHCGGSVNLDSMPEMHKA